MSFKNQIREELLLIYTLHCPFSTVAKSEGPTPRSLLPHCLHWNRVKLVWRQLQLPFDHASLNNFKYTLTCAHPLVGGTKMFRIFWVAVQSSVHTRMGLSMHTHAHTHTPCTVYINLCVEEHAYSAHPEFLYIYFCRMCSVSKQGKGKNEEPNLSVSSLWFTSWENPSGK